MQYEIQIDKLNEGTRGKENKSIGMGENVVGGVWSRRKKIEESGRKQKKREAREDDGRCKV